MTRFASVWLLVSLGSALVSCTNSQQSIGYTSPDNPQGRWGPVANDKGPRDAGEGSNQPDDAEAGGEPSGMEGTPIVVSDGGSGGRDGGKPDAQTDGSDPAMPMEAASSDHRLEFSVTTQVQHMRLTKSDADFDQNAWGPLNIGAIWISTPDGEFVKSLEVWRRNKERSRHLVSYNAACNCPKPDVATMPTLRAFEQHVVTWDGTQRDGDEAPEGMYTLHVEVSDYDVDLPEKSDDNASNAMLNIDFDTRSAPATLNPDATLYYTDIELKLLAP